MKTNLTRVTQSYRRDHCAMHTKFRSRLGLAIVHGTGALFDEHMHAPPSDM